MGNGLLLPHKVGHGRCFWSVSCAALILEVDCHPSDRFPGRFLWQCEQVFGGTGPDNCSCLCLHNQLTCGILAQEGEKLFSVDTNQ